MLHGVNQASGLLLAMLGLNQDQCGRFRDCYLNESGDRILVYTRNGGGNRETYMPDFSGHPLFVKDYDDDFDCTYATLEFKVPDEFKEVCKELADKTDTRTGADKFKATLEALQSGKETASTKKALEVGKQIFGAIESNTDGTISTPDGSVIIKKIQ